MLNEFKKYNTKINNLENIIKKLNPKQQDEK